MALLFVALLVALCTGASSLGCNRIVCTYNDWIRQDYGEFIPDVHINNTENFQFPCTHIHYGLAPITPEGQVMDRIRNQPEVIAKKKTFPDLKVLYIVGGWTQGNSRFKEIVKTFETRVIFALSAAVVLRKYGFDGLEIVWKFPADEDRDESEADHKGNFTLLLRDTMTVFRTDHVYTNKTRLLLAASLGAEDKHIENSYEISEIHKYLDYATLLTHQYNEGQTSKAKPYFPLNKAMDGGLSADDSVSDAVRAWLDAGFPGKKLNIGLPAFARTLKFRSSGSTKPGDATKKDELGDKGAFTRRKGILANYEVCAKINSNINKVVTDQTSVYSYLVTGNNHFITFDSNDTISKKMTFALDEGIGGAHLFSLDLDDFRGETCGQGPYPLLTAVANTCRGGA